MKKLVFGISVISALVLFSCKGKEKEANAEGTTASTEQNTPSNESQPAAATNEPKTFKVTFSPDTVYLGKSKELSVKIKNAKAVELQNPDGKSEGIELSFDMDATNKNKVGGNGIFFASSNFRLQLDNGNNITQDNGNSASIEAESTKELTGITYKIPAGTKPKSLSLFFEETRVSVGVTLE
jgi:hypothetical protein